MGHPLQVLAWLANTLAEQGRSLATGHIVMLGSLVTPAWAEPGDKIDVAIADQPPISVTYT